MRSIFVVFAFPMMRPGESEFLAAYSSPAAAQRFVDMQDADVRDNLRVIEITVDKHPPSDGFWIIPED
jgi:hypothetical protein